MAVNPFPAKSFDPVTPLTHRMVSEEPNDKFKVSTWLCPAAVATSVSALCGKFAEESTTLSCALWLPHATCTGKVKVSDEAVTGSSDPLIAIALGQTLEKRRKQMAKKPTAVADDFVSGLVITDNKLVTSAGEVSPGKQNS